MNIGKPQRTYRIEPVQDPVPARRRPEERPEQTPAAPPAEVPAR